MKGFFTFKSAVGSIVCGLVFAVALVYWTDRTFTLSGLDLFFAVTTVISLGFNLWQLFRDRYKYAPLKNSLIGLVNDLKNRQLRAHGRQILITSPAGVASSAEAVRLEFYDFAEETKLSLEQVREHVVAAIHTLDPDTSSSQVFHAAEFGLSEKERRFREEGLDRFMDNARAARSQAPQSPPANSSTPIPTQASERS